MQSPETPAGKPNALDALDLLASIMADFGTKPKKELTKASVKPSTVSQSPKSIAKQIALQRTRQLIWEPIGRAVWLRTQECQCCGETTEFVENELYLLQNGKASSRWYRQEAHMPELDCTNLPIEIHRNPEPLPVTVCPKCIMHKPTNQLLTLLTSPQLCLEFPDD